MLTHLTWALHGNTGIFEELTFNLVIYNVVKKNQTTSTVYEGQSKITEPYLITFESSKMDIYLDDISL